MKPAVSPRQVAASLHEFWSPRVIGELDDSYVKVARVQGTLAWHSHEGEDELFYILKGRLRIEMERETVELGEGEMYVVPKGVEHVTRAAAECHALVVEPRGVVNTGDAGGRLTAANDVWV